MSACWLLLGYTIGTTKEGKIFHGYPSLVLAMELEGSCVARSASFAGFGPIIVPQVSVRELVSRRWMGSGEWIAKADFWPPHICAHILTELPKYVHLHLHTHEHINTLAYTNKVKSMFKKLTLGLKDASAGKGTCQKSLVTLVWCPEPT